METVGINVTHDASLCKCVNGKITLFLEEERLSRTKYDEIPTNLISQFIDKDEVNFTGLEYTRETLEDKVDGITRYVMKAVGKKYQMHNRHHLLHALCGFYNSEFEEADIVVVDGMGNYMDEDYHECATRWNIKRPCEVKLLEQQGTVRYDSARLWNLIHHGSWPMGIGMAYASIAQYLGFGSLGSGKVMGLAPYGKEDENIKPFVLDNGMVNSKLFYRTEDGANFIPYDYLPEKWDYRVWDNNTQKIANLTYRLQKDFEKWMTDFILRCESKNIVLTGGCALNCVANYEYLKHLPKDVNLYVEPISSDAGTSIGLAKLLYYSKL